jgi:hypothetical protein
MAGRAAMCFPSVAWLRELQEKKSRQQQQQQQQFTKIRYQNISKQM